MAAPSVRGAASRQRAHRSSTLVSINTKSQTSSRSSPWFRLGNPAAHSPDERANFIGLCGGNVHWSLAAQC